MTEYDDNDDNINNYFFIQHMHKPYIMWIDIIIILFKKLVHKRDIYCTRHKFITNTVKLSFYSQRYHR